MTGARWLLLLPPWRVMRRTPGVALCLALLLAACDSGAGKRWYDGSCSLPTDCGQGGLCIESLCAKSCKTSDECGDGVCLKGHCTPKDYACQNGLCEDGNACTVQTCNAATAACSYTFQQGACDDQEPCTIGDECILTVGEQTACKGAAKCDDGDPQTTEFCNADGSCATSP